MYNLNSGYVGQSMSKRAVEAYESGEKPKSKWTKTLILEEIEELIESEEVEINFDLAKLKKVNAPKMKDLLLSYSSWHHSGKYFNEVEFYEVDTWYLEKLTNEKIDEIILEQKLEKEEKEEIKLTFGVITVQVWGGSRKYPKIVGEDTQIGVVKNGRLYYSERKYYQISANKVISFQEFKTIAQLSKKVNIEFSKEDLKSLRKSLQK